MELRHLRYFVAVAEELNVTRAATRLFITQPSLSRQIKDLEKSLGVELFLRGSAGWKLSPAGKELLPQARQLLEMANQTALSMRHFTECRKFALGIGYITPALGSFLGAALPVFAQRHPQIEVRLYELSPGAQIEALRDGRLDIALIGYSCEPLSNEFEIVPIRQLALKAVLPKQHTKAAFSEVRLSGLKDEPFIGYDESAFPGRNDLITSTCQSAGFTPRFAHRVDGLNSALALIGSELGVTLMPDEVEQLPHPGVVFRPLSPPVHIEFSAALQAGEKRPAIQSLLAEFRAAAQNTA